MVFNITSDGSPTPRKGTGRFNMPPGDLRIDTSPEVLGKVNSNSPHYFSFGLRPSLGSSLTSDLQGQKRPLGMSSMGNVSLPPAQLPLQQPTHLGTFKVSRSVLLLCWAACPISRVRKCVNLTRVQSQGESYHDKSVMDSLLQRLNERASPNDSYKSSSSSSVPITPVSEGYSTTPPTMTSSDPSVVVNAAEFQQLRNELQAAKDKIARMNQESHSHNVARSTIEHLGQASDSDYGFVGEVTEQTLALLQNNFNASTRANDGWINDLGRSTCNTNNSFGSQYVGQPQPQARPSVSVGQPAVLRGNNYLNEPTHFSLDQGFRGGGLSNGMSNNMSNGAGTLYSAAYNSLNKPPSRPDSAFDTYNQYAASTFQSSNYSVPIGTVGGSRLSPVANEFDASTGLGSSPWNSQVSWRDLCHCDVD